METSLDDFVDYIEVTVETLWQNKVAVRDRYIKEATEKQKALVLKFHGDKMRIPFEYITGRILFKSKKPFKDRYSNAEHWLYYFAWRPEGQQKRIIEPTPVKKEVAPKQRSLFD